MKNTQCPDCKSFKKASNCIQCYREAMARYQVLKGKYLALIDCIEGIVKTNSYLRIGDAVCTRLMQERKSLE